MRPKTFAVIFLLLAVSCSFAKEQVTDDGFVIIDANICEFKLKGYKLSKPIEEAIVFGISLILDTYKDTFGFSYPDDFKLKITIIADKDEFLDYQKKQVGEIISETGYYYYKHTDDGTITYSEAVVCKNKKGAETIAMLFHETSHLMLRYQLPWVPTWVNEGLAEYFAGLEVIGPNKRIFLKKYRSDWCKYWLKNSFPMGLKEYISLSHDDWMAFRRKDTNAAYTIGYSLVYFMMSRHTTQKVLKEILWDLKEHGKDADSVKTIDEHYPGGFKKFEKMWKKWIPRARPYRPLRALRKKADKKNQPKTQ